MNTNFPSSTPPDRQVVSSTPLSAQASPSSPSSPLSHSYTSPYLPAGAPAWPTTILQRPESSAENAQKIAVNGPRGKASRSLRSAMITLGVIVLTLLVGAGLTYGVLLLNGQAGSNTSSSSSRVVTIPQGTQTTPTVGANSTATSTTNTATSLPTPTSFSSMSTDHQKSIGVIVKYPSDWVEDPSTASSGASIATFHPQQTLGIAIYVGKFTVTSTGVTTADAWNTEVITEIYGANNGSGSTNLKAVQATNPNPTIGGQQWDEQDATFNDANSALIHVSSITIERDTSFYSFIYQTPDVYYNDIVQKYVPPMINSFKFLS